jgi:hypothetical protein
MYGCVFRTDTTLPFKVTKDTSNVGVGLTIELGHSTFALS